MYVGIEGETLGQIASHSSHSSQSHYFMKVSMAGSCVIFGAKRNYYRAVFFNLKRWQIMGRGGVELKGEESRRKKKVW